MLTPIANLTLPAMCQVVCTLLATEYVGVNFTSSGSLDLDNLSPATTQPPTRDEPAPLPTGYVAYPDVEFAYKVYAQTKVFWVEARNRCIEDGAQLAMIDTPKKLEHIKSLNASVYYVHVGIVRMYDDTTWVSISTGSPVTLLPWLPDNPKGDKDCVKMQFAPAGLYNVACTSSSTAPYVCEIPIPRINTMPVN